MITSPTYLRKIEWRGLGRYSFLQPVIVLARLSRGRMATSDAALEDRCAWEVERRVRVSVLQCMRVHRSHREACIRTLPALQTASKQVSDN